MTRRKGCGCFSLIIIILIIALLVGIGIKNKDKILAFFYPQSMRALSVNIVINMEWIKWLVFALIKAESGFDADAVSAAGAYGLMQLMPDTAQWLIDRGEFAMEATAALENPRRKSAIRNLLFISVV